MNLRDYYNVQIIEYFTRHKITYIQKISTNSNYYYITNIKGKNGHTLKIRVSNHNPLQDYEIPFLKFYYGKHKNFPSKHAICCNLGAYIAKYKAKVR